MDVIILSRAISLQAEMYAIYAEIEGMKALNQYRIDRQETIAYDDKAFQEQADRLNDIANFLRELGRG